MTSGAGFSSPRPKLGPGEVNMLIQRIWSGESGNTLSPLLSWKARPMTRAITCAARVESRRSNEERQVVRTARRSSGRHTIGGEEYEDEPLDVIEYPLHRKSE